VLLSRLRSVALLALSATIAAAAACAGETAPRALTDAEFWDLTARLSEPVAPIDHPDNLVSNELHFPHLVRMLRPGGGAYIGVGPEQNFSYIARLEPALAFIVDIRPENRSLHLLYKALFELSSDRAAFLSRLLSRGPPPGLDSTSSPDELFAAYATVQPSRKLYESTLREVEDRLLNAHRFTLTDRDLEWIRHVLDAFLADGANLHYGPIGANDTPGPSYRELMTAKDTAGQDRSYLATEGSFALVKDLHARNLIVPVVGDFAGPHALRRAGDYIREHQMEVDTFYGSNVEVYLTRQRAMAFCGNLSSLPFAPGAWFIGSRMLQRVSTKLRGCAI
jgi:hypothetical protein